MLVGGAVAYLLWLFDGSSQVAVQSQSKKERLPVSDGVFLFENVLLHFIFKVVKLVIQIMVIKIVYLLFFFTAAL